MASTYRSRPRVVLTSAPDDELEVARRGHPGVRCDADADREPVGPRPPWRAHQRSGAPQPQPRRQRSDAARLDVIRHGRPKA
jgi:hypothetical protein